MKPFSKSTSHPQEVRSTSSEGREDDGVFGDRKIEDFKNQLEGERKKVVTLEATLNLRETEIGKLRLDLASAESALEQAQNELKVKVTASARKEAEQGKLELDLQNKTNKVGLVLQLSSF